MFGNFGVKKILSMLPIDDFLPQIAPAITAKLKEVETRDDETPAYLLLQKDNIPSIHTVVLDKNTGKPNRFIESIPVEQFLKNLINLAKS